MKSGFPYQTLTGQDASARNGIWAETVQERTASMRYRTIPLGLIKPASIDLHKSFTKKVCDQ